MAYAQTVSAPRAFAFRQKAARAPKPSLLSRVFHYVDEANRRRADREIARYMDSIGGKFTDSAEREIENRYLSNVMR